MPPHDFTSACLGDIGDKLNSAGDFGGGQVLATKRDNLFFRSSGIILEYDVGFGDFTLHLIALTSDGDQRDEDVAIGHGEQAEVFITTVRLAQALLVPEAAIIGLSKNHGTVWTVENGTLQRREVTLGHRLLDGRYEITGGVPTDAKVVTQLASGLSVGRAATIASEPKR